MLKSMACLAVLGLIAAAPAQAQDPRVEIQGWAGYTFSDGVSGDAREGSDGNVYNRATRPTRAPMGSRSASS